MAVKRVDKEAFDRLERISRVLDTALEVPGTGIRIGADALVGFIPGAGDLLGMLLSSYIILEAARLGAPRHALGIMVGNVVLDTLVGSVPVLGDIFDIFFKANRRNVNLLRRYVRPA